MLKKIVLLGLLLLGLVAGGTFATVSLYAPKPPQAPINEIPFKFFCPWQHKEIAEYKFETGRDALIGNCS